MIYLSCDTQGCDNEAARFSDDELADAEGVIECEYCGKYLTKASRTEILIFLARCHYEPTAKQEPTK